MSEDYNSKWTHPCRNCVIEAKGSEDASSRSEYFSALVVFVSIGAIGYAKPHSQRLQILAARGKTVRMVTYPGSPHFRTWGAATERDAGTVNWLAKYNKSPGIAEALPSH